MNNTLSFNSGIYFVGVACFFSWMFYVSLLGMLAMYWLYTVNLHSIFIVKSLFFWTKLLYLTLNPSHILNILSWVKSSVVLFRVTHYSKCNPQTQSCTWSKIATILSQNKTITLKPEIRFFCAFYILNESSKVWTLWTMSHCSIRSLNITNWSNILWTHCCYDWHSSVFTVHVFSPS